MAKTQSTRIKTVPMTAPGLSLEDATAQIQASFSDPTSEANALLIEHPSATAAPVAASSASESAKEPARAPESPQSPPPTLDTAPRIRPGQLYRATSDDSIEPVSDDEALRYERLNADYTTKTQALAEERRQFYAEQAAMKAEREQLVQEKLRTAALLRQATPVEPDWNQVYAEDPVNAPAKYMAWDIRQKQIAKAEQEAREAQQKAMVERQTTERARLLELIPEWQDAGRRQQEMGELSQYIAAQGWDQQTLSAVLNDSRALRLARTAMFAERKQATPEQQSRTQIKIDRVKVAPPGAASVPKPGPSVLEQKMRVLRQKPAGQGSVNAAADVLRELFNG
jgi:hypothetical protein